MMKKIGTYYAGFRNCKQMAMTPVTYYDFEKGGTAICYSPVLYKTKKQAQKANWIDIKKVTVFIED